MTHFRRPVNGDTLWGISMWKRRVSLAALVCSLAFCGSASGHPDSPPALARPPAGGRIDIGTESRGLALRGAAAAPHPFGAAAEPRAETTFKSAPWAFFAGFTSVALANPGVHLGAEYSLARAGGFESLAVAAVQVYDQPNTETGLALHARWGHRYTASFGLTFDSQLGLGAQYTRYDTTVFEFQDSRATAVESTDARVAFSPQVVFGPGYDFEPVLSLPVSLYARPGVVLLYPDLNQAFQAFVIAELGLSWTP